ncbi:hypothetical protein [Siphonobacter curvatus]|uniref:Uncharacterized protein n=1 Tax=Siphonobacter curvatus TaxID=2094562 RepID=A0A2S7IN69_9BACT|nr:hypothetical protein [Siphonobacter curvatus]PQA59167.1 hypothetical protein C5O19_05790 [Siphonobacter curvatus]
MWTLADLKNKTNQLIRLATRQKKISNTDLADVLDANAEFVDERHNSMKATFDAFTTTYPERFSKLSVTLYVSQAGGSDTNTGLNNALPLKSLRRAAELVDYRFQRVHIYIQGNYDVTENIVFHVNELVLYLESNRTLTFKKRIIGQGETVNSLRVDGTYLKIEAPNDATAQVVTEENAGYLREDPYWIKATLGAIKIGNGELTYFSYLPSLVNLYNVQVQLGANTALVSGSNGTADANFFAYHVGFEHNVKNWTIASSAMVSPFCRQGYFRKEILFNNSSSWFSVGTQASLQLHNGMYAIRAVLDSWKGGGVVYNGMYSGVLTWHGEPTNDSTSEAREITLHGMGHNLAGKSLKLRTVTVANSLAPAGQAQRIEVQLNEVLSSAIVVEFYYHKLT